MLPGGAPDRDATPAGWRKTPKPCRDTPKCKMGADNWSEGGSFPSTDGEKSREVDLSLGGWACCS